MGLFVPRMSDRPGRRVLRLLLAAFVWALDAGFSDVEAATVKLTIYDDGLSCPHECDAHVVFHKSMNGTQFAHAPKAPAKPYGRCLVGSTCRLCLESGEKQCLEAIYRGGGPPPDTFDFTPRFYLSACATSPAQPALAAQCTALKHAAASLDGLRNCIAEPGHVARREMMERATTAREQDRAEYERCRLVGEARYNPTKPVAQQRSLSCAYERVGTGGPNSKGVTWRKLLPGACRDGTFVGRDGLDCCSGIPLSDGPLRRECRHFYLSE
jgi:hypothetical protein